DRSASVARALGVRVLVVENRGLGFLYNRGAEAVTAEFILLSNPDVSFAPDCVELLARELDADETLFAADPRQDAWDGVALVHARATLRRGRLLRELLPGFHLDLRAPAERTAPTVTANGGAMLVRRERLLALGGFDEAFFLDYEDIDLCWRAWLRGWGSVYVPSARLRHRVGGSTSTEIVSARVAQSHYNVMRFALKCLPPGAALRVLLAEVLRLGVHPRLVAPSLLRLGASLPEILRLRRAIRPRRDLLDWMLAGQPMPHGDGGRPRPEPEEARAGSGR
ncbi:MAG: glycosyltransferase, partial [Rhodospirillales bacterium]|nr:glycosyltransferase [Rhodospirillales bacterium]